LRMIFSPSYNLLKGYLYKTFMNILYHNVDFFHASGGSFDGKYWIDDADIFSMWKRNKGIGASPY
ncbi:MAG: hypothetical protein PHW46_05685, partial [Candidatus Omnitrophica bacterium]|nr:hypothetical protein [Candidatus Omnitrophota bacterium]